MRDPDLSKRRPLSLKFILRHDLVTHKYLFLFLCFKYNATRVHSFEPLLNPLRNFHLINNLCTYRGRKGAQLQNPF